MSAQPVTITITPALAAIIADALTIAERRSREDAADHRERVGRSADRLTRGEPHPGDAEYVAAADDIAATIAALASEQDAARWTFDDIAGDLAGNPAGAALILAEGRA